MSTQQINGITIYPIETDYLNGNENAIVPFDQSSLDRIIEVLTHQNNVPFKEILLVLVSNGWVAAWTEQS